MNNGKTCVVCERPIYFASFASKVSAWVHAEPLGRLRVSAMEGAAVMADAAAFAGKPREHGSGREIGRHFENIHQAEPDRSI